MNDVVRKLAHGDRPLPHLVSDRVARQEPDPMRCERDEHLGGNDGGGAVDEDHAGMS